MQLILRAHHLLCIQGYQGKGYSNEFINNMNKIVNILKNNLDTKIKIISKTDFICSKCPSNIGNGLCKSETKVHSLDSKTLEILDLKKNQIYVYKEILSIIKKNLTLEKFQYICKNCEWFKYGYCEKGLFEKSLITP
ncbi:DUF1284 domain-containing protein [Tepidibacter formicigenes]|jgi:hypothetical protein|uniref:DUF1284 domain-containing protein n=1 Tax=Tepidibacter formicigenes DSM 15518 TaxID=1123349 RepID=A0A1M6T878_9FIRM|nr:DUF1284 domain-containing protein [Tepidibacter formicigenes]SHK53242.1 hypothetical protein SAMN02744037_02539 [Tepidibacter formicigenes DSM 15518]